MSILTQSSYLSRLTLSGVVMLSALTAGTTPVSSEDAERSGRLRWRNGDELPGVLLPSEEGTVRFAAKPFSEPLTLNLGQLASIRFTAGGKKSERASGPSFEVTLDNGDRLDGRLLEIGRDTITLDCDPLPDPTVIKRSSVIRIAQLESEHLRFSELGELTQWTSTGRDRKTTDWYTDLLGDFATHQWSGNIFHEISFPERVEIHFRARFPLGNPNFEVGLLRNPQDGPMLETWDDHLVLTYLTRFTPVMKLTPETRELEFRLFWNQKTGEVLLCNASGEELASLTGDPTQPVPPPRKTPALPTPRGFSILNRSPELRLISLRVMEWNGAPVPVIDLSRPRLHLRDASTRFQTRDVTLRKGSSALEVGAKSVPLGDLIELILSAEPAEPTGKDLITSTRIAWQSGTTLSGKFVSVGPGELKILPPWSSGPVKVTLEGAREIRFPENAEPLETPSDILSGEGFSLRGTMRLASAAEGNELLAWMAPGASSPSPLNEATRSVITRNLFPNEEVEPPVTTSQARLYLNNDEILTGEFVSVSPESIEFESRLTGRMKIPSSQVRAMDIGTVGRLLNGFRDPEWEVFEEITGQTVLTPEVATLNGGGFGNPSILMGDRIRFDVEWKQSYGAMTVRLFASGPDNTNPSSDVIIAAQGNRIFIGKLKEDGAFSFSGDQIPMEGSKASIDISAQPEKIEIRINGKSALNLDVAPDQVSGNGLYFKTGGGWQGWNQADSPIEISNFSIESSPGSIPRRVIDRRAKEHSLSVPRAFQDRVPLHLLIAPNGDLLRGKLESATRDLVQFTAEEETLSIPATRVSSIVWLRPPLPEQPDPASESKLDTGENDKNSTREAPEVAENPVSNISHQFVLRDGSRLQLAGDRIEGNRFVGISAILGECRFSIDNIREVRCWPSPSAGRIDRMPLIAFDDWQTRFTPEPAIPESEGGPVSPLIGKTAPSLELTMLDETPFKLSDLKGSVVVLDFWATWCGPCIKAMPDITAVVAAFPPGTVYLCAINQGETPPIVNDFLKKREWQDIPVALDFNMKVSRAFEVESIPYTVVIDREGKIAWVHSGYSEDLREKLFEAIAATLQP